MFFAKFSTRHRHAMKSAVAAASPLLAFRVQDHSTQATAAPIAPRQQFEKRFTLESSPDAKRAPALDRIVVATPGVTFISFDADAAVPIVKVSAEKPETVEAFEVVPRGESGIEIRLKNELEQRLYVLTEVSLPVAYALRALEVHGSGTVVLEDNVLPTNDPQAQVAIALSGSGDILASSHSDLHLGSLVLDLKGSGDVQFVAPSVTLRDAFTSRITSSGDVRVFVGSITAPRVTLSTSGSGDVQIAALNVDVPAELETSVSGSGTIKTIGETLKADTVSSSIAGSGGVKLVTTTEFVANTVRASVSGSGAVCVAAPSARCAEGKISIAGSGFVDARDLVAHHPKANVSGSGSILIRASEAIDAFTGGSGSVTVVGNLPPHVSGNLRTKTEEQKPSKVDTLAAKRAPSMAAPTRVEAFEKPTRFNGTINIESFSDFVDAAKLLWNRQKGDNIKVVAKVKSGGANSDDERP